MNIAQILSLKATLEKFFIGEQWLDFEVIRYDRVRGGTLTIAASRDFTYYHNAEISFNEVAFYCGPFSWKCSPQQTGILAPCSDSLAVAAEGDGRDILVCFLNDDCERIELSASIASVNFDTVFYYKREILGANERIAEWVTDGGDSG